MEFEEIEESEICDYYLELFTEIGSSEGIKLVNEFKIAFLEIENKLNDEISKGIAAIIYYIIFHIEISKCIIKKDEELINKSIMNSKNHKELHCCYIKLLELQNYNWFEADDFTKYSEEFIKQGKYDIAQLAQLIQLDKQIDKSKNLQIENSNSEQNKIYPQIFKNANSFNFFENLKMELVRKNCELADFSFIYRRMYKDELIYKQILESHFRDFLFSKYEIEIEKLKLLDYCKTDLKETIYSNSKSTFQPL